MYCIWIPFLLQIFMHDHYTFKFLTCQYWTSTFSELKLLRDVYSAYLQFPDFTVECDSKLLEPTYSQIFKMYFLCFFWSFGAKFKIDRWVLCFRFYILHQDCLKSCRTALNLILSGYLGRDRDILILSAKEICCKYML